MSGCADDRDRHLLGEEFALTGVPLSVVVNSVSTRKAYVTATAAVGITYYIDRTFKIGSLSAGLAGGILIKTANDDKNVTTANHLTFTPSAASTVYVAFDKRATRLPGWIDGTWRLTGESFTSNGDGAASPMGVYAKNFAAGQVRLGGNKQSPAAGASSCYVVIVVASPGQGGSGGAGGGAGTGGAGTGGSATGGRGTGGAGTGGVSTGGVGTGGAGTGGSATGGRGTGGAGTGGASTGGVGTGGASTGGAGTGGSATGGASTGGAGTGGSATGGSNTGGTGTGGVGTGGTSSGGAGGGSPSASLYVVAHPDDELLFMNPDLETDIQAGRSTLTVYATSGDGGDPNVDWRGREASVRAAHAAMAGVTNSWSCAAATYAGKPTVKCTLSGKPTVKMVFLRLLDGSLNELPIGNTVGTIDASTTYTAAQLTATLAAIQTEVQPGHVGTLDGTLAHGPDHQDHITSAIFAFGVARTDGVARQLVMYRGYSIYEPSFVDPPAPSPEPENLSTAQYQEKLRILKFYQAPPLDDPFDPWCHRFYPITNVNAGTGPLHTAAGQCLQASGTADGSAVVIAPCNGAASQTWTRTGGNRVTTSTGQCLGVGPDGSNVVVKTCSAGADQIWTLLSDGELRGTSEACLAISGSGVFSATCEADTSAAHYFPLVSQRWSP
jgi:LmbE family N-acetylglucosaminyl deacetylase